MRLPQADNLALNYEGFFLMALTLQGVTYDLDNLLGGVNFGTDPLTFQGAAGTQNVLTAPDTASSAGSGNPALGGASIGLAIGQAIGGMYSAWKGGKTLDYVMNKQAEISEQNRQMAQLSAESAMRQGEAAVAQLTYRAGQIKAKQRTAFASSGVVLGEGSTAEVTATTDIMKEMDKKTAEMNALSAAWGFKQQALQGGIYSGMAGYAKSAKQSEGFSSLLDGGMTAADRWYRYFGAS